MLSLDRLRKNHSNLTAGKAVYAGGLQPNGVGIKRKDIATTTQISLTGDYKREFIQWKNLPIEEKTGLAKEVQNQFEEFYNSLPGDNILKGKFVMLHDEVFTQPSHQERAKK